MKKALLLISAAMVMNVALSQKKPVVVNEVDLKRYAGTWYEISRLPNSFEKNLKCITATYTLRDDGKIGVLNQGRKINDPLKKDTANGVAKVPDKNVPGKLRVSFFRPFWGNYWILYLDKDYRHVLVGDPSYKYLWILNREKTMDESTYSMLIEKAREQGYDTEPMIKVEHDCN